MRITSLAAYERIVQKFYDNDFKEGNESQLRIYSYERGMQGTLTPGHYVDAINYGRIKFADVPKECRTRDFFLHTAISTAKDVVNYVREHIGEEFDKEFFKDHIATTYYALEFEDNCFEYMPLEYIDEEMVSYAMLKSIGSGHGERKVGFKGWFYSVARRKPEVLTQDFWTLGARLWAVKIGKGENEFLKITPEQYRTKEYYFAMCLENGTPVMEDFPKEVITTRFLIALINLNVNNIRSFSSEALEEKTPVTGQDSEITFWQAAIRIDGYMVKYIPLNEERVKFFLEHYDKDSSEYRYGFKDVYKRWLKKQQEAQQSKQESKGDSD